MRPRLPEHAVHLRAERMVDLDSGTTVRPGSVLVQGEREQAGAVRRG